MVRRRFHSGRAVQLAGLVAAVLACGVASSSAALGAQGATYALASDGWRPGDGVMLAAGAGVFHAGRVDGRVCAWVGGSPGDVLWPAGYRVRLAPSVELISPGGSVVATAGESIGFEGGNGLVVKGAACGHPGEEEFLIQGPVPLAS
jgi:hypothetical protein